MKNLNKVSKIAIGSTISILLASAVGLEYSISAGIITLLTIQDTKKETIYISLKRVTSFIIAALLAFILFGGFGFTTINFGIFLFLFVGICSIANLQDGISMNSVLATHYILSGRIDITMIANEFALLLIGASIGTLINLIMPDNKNVIKQIQKEIEEDLRKILFRMAYFLREDDKGRYTSQSFSSLQQHINLGLKHAYTNMNNTLFQESWYFIRYMEMRNQQLQILISIYEKIKSLTTVPDQATPLSAFIEQIANTLNESNNAKSLLQSEHHLEEGYKQNALPTSRKEFEDRAILFMILKDFKVFLLIKEQFVNTLTKEQIDKYWI